MTGQLYVWTEICHSETQQNYTIYYFLNSKLASTIYKYYLNSGPKKLF